MDTFFQKLRDIQKKERNTGTLSEIDDSFYTDASNYLQELLKKVNNNPLSLEAYQLRDAQRITIEICERREFKIVSTAATNVQKDHDIFKGHKKNSELYDVIPYNTTPEEEEFYRQIVDMLIDYRENLMDKIVLNRNNETKIGFKPVDKQLTRELPVKSQDTSEEESVEDSRVDAPIETSVDDEVKVNKPSKPKKPVLDESQIAMMFGQAPDDTLLDEDNNPVKPVKRDITTPFTGPKAPKEDTVVLQNRPKQLGKTVETNIEEELDTESGEQLLDNETSEENILEEVPEEEVIEETVFENEELVKFTKEIVTDILDEHETTYGPFFVDDIVLLPKSLVKILNDNEVINIIK